MNSWKLPALQFAYMLVLAYAAAFVVNRVVMVIFGMISTSRKGATRMVRSRSGKALCLGSQKVEGSRRFFIDVRHTFSYDGFRRCSSLRV
jgi:hypothetical protein